jgi:hypothetical protein
VAFRELVSRGRHGYLDAAPRLPARSADDPPFQEEFPSFAVRTGAPPVLPD